MKVLTICTADVGQGNMITNMTSITKCFGWSYTQQTFINTDKVSHGQVRRLHTYTDVKGICAGQP